MHDIQIQSQTNVDGTSSAPLASVSSKLWPEPREIKISISHDGDYATAVCLAAEDTTSSPAPYTLPKADHTIVGSDSDQTVASNHKESNTRTSRGQKKIPKSKKFTTDLTTRTICVSNISPTTTESTLLKTFSSFSSAIIANIPITPTGKLASFGFVTFEYRRDVIRVLSEYNSKGWKVEVDGSPVKIHVKGKGKLMQRGDETSHDQLETIGEKTAEEMRHLQAMNTAVKLIENGKFEEENINPASESRVASEETVTAFAKKKAMGAIANGEVVERSIDLKSQESMDWKSLKDRRKKEDDEFWTNAEELLLLAEQDEMDRIDS
jgi:hypothetical protein